MGSGLKWKRLLGYFLLGLGSDLKWKRLLGYFLLGLSEEKLEFKKYSLLLLSDPNPSKGKTPSKGQIRVRSPIATESSPTFVQIDSGRRIVGW